MSGEEVGTQVPTTGRRRFLGRLALLVTGAGAAGAALAEKASALAGDITEFAQVTLRPGGSGGGATVTQLLKIVPSLTAPPSGSTGGAVLLDNSLNTGPGLVVYTSAAGNNRLVSLSSTSASHSSAALHVDYGGTLNAVEIIQNNPNAGGGPTYSNALSVVSNNQADTTVGIRGRELQKGTVKITHDNPSTSDGTADGGAAAISILLRGPQPAVAGVHTAAQGIFLDSESATIQTTGTLLNLRNGGVERLVLKNSGDLVVGTLPVPSKVISTGGIGVGNSAAASGGTPGAPAKKMQIFDAGGLSLGYVPIYNTL